jgi:hypothetical protein
MTRRNNNVFLVGTPVEVTERSVWVGTQETPLVELRLRTDRPEITGHHQVLVRGRQAEELRHFLAVAHPERPDIMVLGWLRSGEENVVMAERVTVLVSREVRQAAVEAIRRAQGK